MYIILSPDHQWYIVNTWEEVKDFLNKVFFSDSNTFYKTVVFKCVAPYKWEEIAIPTLPL